MAHIMLPSSPPDTQAPRPGTFADTGVAELIASMEKLGAERSRMVCAIAGGASLRTSLGEMDMGRKTADAVMLQLRNMGVKCSAVDLGGNVGRTVTMATESGKVVVSTINHGENLLCNLRSA
jgi:chemotaxis protein CheD